MLALIDTNVLVYRYDVLDSFKRRVASELLRQRLQEETAVLPHPALVEFVSAVTRPRRELEGRGLLTC